MYPSTDRLLKVLRVITETVKENATYKQNATNYTDWSFFKVLKPSKVHYTN